MHDPVHEWMKEDLAYRYVHGSLGPEEKQQVFELVLADPEFVAMLRDELQLVRSMEAYRSELEPGKKQELLQRIKRSCGTESSDQSIVFAAVKPILRMTMPSIAYRTLILFKGDVWA
jgi:flagellar biosynthesis component FlhA